jgi:hypothetical protein
MSKNFIDRSDIVIRYSDNEDGSITSFLSVPGIGVTVCHDAKSKQEALEKFKKTFQDLLEAETRRLNQIINHIEYYKNQAERESL